MEILEVLYPHDSKPSLEKQQKKLRESHSNLEKESFKHDLPTKNSLDVEAEMKEKQTFLTEAQKIDMELGRYYIIHHVYLIKY